MNQPGAVRLRPGQPGDRRGLAREGLRRAAAGLRAAFADGSDLEARTDMAMCSLLGGMALANAKLGAVHVLSGRESVGSASGPALGRLHGGD